MAYFTVGIRKSKAHMHPMQSDSGNASDQHKPQGRGGGKQAQPQQAQPQQAQSQPPQVQHQQVQQQQSQQSQHQQSQHEQVQQQQSQQSQHKSNQHPQDQPTHPQKPTLTQIAVATSHCGAGCTLADLSTEFLLGAFSVTLFGLTLWASFVYDFLVAWTLGILFQYLSMQSMRHLLPGQAILAAIKADTLSITAFQIGMYAWMALVFFVLFPHPHLTPFDPCFWLMMQIAMILGYATAFPMNRFLIRASLREAMQ